MYGVRDCTCLEESDKYFENLLNQSAVRGILGFIELNSDELNYIADLISKEVVKPSFAKSESLTVSIFLVWIGIIYYQDGNFWSHVYNILNISSDQMQLQKYLGEIFLKTVKKYKLVMFKDKLRYIMPILAHGFIPNFYLNDYFSNIILRIYREREEAGLNINFEEVKHIVSNWRKEYKAYIEKEDRIHNLDEKERELLIAKDVFLNFVKLQHLIKLRKLIKKSQVLKELLLIPDRWLEEKEAESEKISLQLERFREIFEKRSTFENEYKELNNRIKSEAKKLFNHWDDESAKAVLDISIDEIKLLFKSVMDDKKRFGGPMGLFFRLFMPRKYMMMNDNKRKLAYMFVNIPIKEDFLKDLNEKHIDELINFQELLKKKKNLELSLKEIVESEREAAAAISDTYTTEDIVSQFKKQLEKTNNEIASYKQNLVILGKGKLDEGKEELNEQRNLRKKIKSIKSEIFSQYDINTLVKNLSLKLKYSSEHEIEEQLKRVQQKKKGLMDEFKDSINPLYFMNESTRVFIYQGGEIADQFIFQSLLLIQSLEHEKENTYNILLPSRIKKSMEDWWQQEGKNLLTEERKRKEQREGNRISVHKPIIRLDTIERAIKVEIPSQFIENQEEVIFTLNEESDIRKEIKIDIRKTDDKNYCTVPVSFNIERPMEGYHFKLLIGKKFHEWKVKGIDKDYKFMFFTNGKELIEDLLYLPYDSLYIVVPIGSKFTPNEIVKERERLIGDWSAYEFCYIDLNENDMFLIESGGGQYLYKKRVNIKLQVLKGNMLKGVHSGGKTVYNNRLPDIVFSINDYDDISYYGLRFDYQDNSIYMPLADFDAFIKSGNVILINLGAIVSHIYGVCKVSLIYKQSIIWTDDIVVVPDLNIKFNQKLYPPQEKGKIQLGILELSSQYPFKVMLYTNANVVEVADNKNYIEFDTANDQVDLLLQYFLDTEVSIDISIVVPKIYWKTDDTEEWCSSIEEIWFEDIGNFYLKLPTSTSTKVKLTLSPDVQTIVPTVKKEAIVFNLRQFSDSIRSCNKVLQDLVLSFDDEDISPILLGRIRLYWQVKDIVLSMKIDNGKRIISIKWEDLGKASNRVVRLWPLNEENLDMIEYIIADGVSQLEISEDIEKLPIGTYRLQFDVDDPWSDDEALLPMAEDGNCMDIIVGDKREILQEVIENGLDIVAFDVDGKKIVSEGNYWIDDIKTYSEFEGEEGMVGNIYTFGESGNIVPLEYNPASFYFMLDPKYFTKLPFLIDRDKDGYTYCKRCKVLFSEIAHRECRNDVILPDSIFVRIRRRG